MPLLVYKVIQFIAEIQSLMVGSYQLNIMGNVSLNKMNDNNFQPPEKYDICISIVVVNGAGTGKKAQVLINSDFMRYSQ